MRNQAVPVRNRARKRAAAWVGTFLMVGSIALGGALVGCATNPGKTAPTASAKPEIYDSAAQGDTLLASALARAAKAHKRVLLDLGANWCSDSQAMYRLLREDRAISRELDQHYVLLLVDANTRVTPPRNAALLERLGSPLVRGIPVLLVLSADGTVLNADAAERLADSDHQFPAKVLDYLRKWSGDAR